MYAIACVWFFHCKKARLHQRRHVFYVAHSAEMSVQLKAARSQAEASKQELADYKEKAARILQVY
jgi:hypothetical protein